MKHLPIIILQHFVAFSLNVWFISSFVTLPLWSKANLVKLPIAFILWVVIQVALASFVTKLVGELKKG